MTNKILNIVKGLVYIQIPILFISDLIFQVYKPIKKIDFIIGVHEISSNIYNLKKVINKSKSVNLNPNKYYDYQYDYGLNIKNKYFRFLINLFYSPFLLGYLCNKTNKFIYIWDKGFLIDRSLEFKFLKSKDKKIILFFCGDDIRSPKLSLEYSDNLGVENFLHFVQYDLDIQEKKVKKTAIISDKYGDLIFNFPICQKSYLKKRTYFPTYIYNPRRFNFLDGKFKNIKKFKIVHAPSNPNVKGTNLVREAINQLIVEGYKINYIELQERSNIEVLNELKESHIVLNSFYGLGYTIGTFGVEALANCNCLLTSICSETTYFGNSIILSELNNVCVNTKYWEIQDKLKNLLDNPRKVERYAYLGYNFALENFEYSKAQKYYESIFDKELN